MSGVALARPSAERPRTPPRTDVRDHVALASDDVERALAARPSSAAASDAESLLLARCAGQIAREAGAGAVVHAIAAPQQAALLRDAIAALAPTCVGARRGALVYLPRSAVALLDADELLALIGTLAARHPAGALLVIAVESSSHRGRTAGGSPTRTLGCGVPCVEQLARSAGWELCQLWTDGTARHALVVCERALDVVAVRAS